jgi:UDP-glucose 4-epimerase
MRQKGVTYLMAIASQYHIQANIVRPGYTFGNPCVEGGPLYPDHKIVNMVKSALANGDIPSWFQ